MRSFTAFPRRRCRKSGPSRVSMGGAIQSGTSSAFRRLPDNLILVSLLLLIFVTPAHGRDFVVKRNLQGYTMEVSINRNPPILGKNDIKVEIRDSLGKHVVDAPVTVNYFMPPMPGMAGGPVISSRV